MKKDYIGYVWSGCAKSGWLLHAIGNKTRFIVTLNDESGIFVVRDGSGATDSFSALVDAKKHAEKRFLDDAIAFMDSLK